MAKRLGDATKILISLSLSLSLSLFLSPSTYLSIYRSTCWASRKWTKG
jgi:hypothetical protein